MRNVAACGCLALWERWATQATRRCMKSQRTQKKRIAIINKVKPSSSPSWPRRQRQRQRRRLWRADQRRWLRLDELHVRTPSETPEAFKSFCRAACRRKTMTPARRTRPRRDVALIKLFPKKPGDKFPYVTMATAQDAAGDWSWDGQSVLAATDFSPTVTYA